MSRKMNLTYRKKRYKIENEDRETLRHISETLDKVLAVLLKSPNKVRVIMDFAVTGVTLLSVIGIIEIVKNWLGG